LEGLVQLQEQFLELKILKIKNALRGINLIKEWGRDLIKEWVCRQKALVVLDDVDKLEQLDALFGERSWFSSKSRIIITTRNDHLLNEIEPDEKN
jgi:hypothetical protein